MDISTVILLASVAMIFDVCKACESGFWEPGCNYRCNNCSNGKCDISTRVCKTCPDGFAGELCNIKCQSSTCLSWRCDRKTGFQCSKCVYGFWGVHCEKQCKPQINCYNCHKTTGICNSCVGGYWGTNCERKCSENCACTNCNRTTGACTACSSGFWGEKCEHGCNYNCAGNCEQGTGRCYYHCKHGWWGPFCENKCKVREGCASCSKIYGSCIGCSIGYWGRLCENKCPSLCTACERYTGKCSKCRPGHKGLNCSSTCIEENCETCKGSNESYSCTKCRAGYWGEGCQFRCRPERCLICSMTTGRCSECEDGFWGHSCNEKCHDHCQCCSLSLGSCFSPRYCFAKKPKAAPSQTNNTLIVVGIVLIVCSLVVLSLAFGLFCYIKRRSKQAAGTSKSEDRNVVEKSVSYSLDRKNRPMLGNNLFKLVKSITPIWLKKQTKDLRTKTIMKQSWRQMTCMKILRF